MRLRVVFMVLGATEPSGFAAPQRPAPPVLAHEQWLNPGRVPNIGESVVIDVHFEERWLCCVINVVTEHDSGATCCTCLVRQLEKQ